MLASQRNGTLYAGISGNLGERLFQHRKGVGSVFVRKYAVTRLVWFEWCELYEEAIRRETRIKKWKRAWKIALIEEANPGWRDLTDQLFA